MVEPIPPGYHTVTPYLPVRGMARCLEFCCAAFDAEVVGRQDSPDGAPRHADVLIGDSHVMMGECPPADQQGGHGPMPAMMYLYVPDVDAVYGKAKAAGGETVEEPDTKFYGDRTAAVKDACGNVWYLATHVEDVAPEEMQQRMEAQSKG